MSSNFQLDIHPVGVLPDASLEGRDVLIYNQCDGYHIATIHFDEEGEFDGFWPFGGKEFTQDFYRAWALLPDCNEDLFPLFAEKDTEDAASVLWCVHIDGPDDIIATPSKAAAEAIAESINKAFANSERDYGVRIKASAIPYDSDADDHQRNLEENYGEYAHLVVVAEEPKA